MNKLTIVAAIAIMSAAIISWQAPLRTITLTLTEAQLQQLWYVIDNSNAPHPAVKAVQDEISAQVNRQVADTAKPASPKKP